MAHTWRVFARCLPALAREAARGPGMKGHVGVRCAKAGFTA